jgi:YHS domain-containing protein
MRNLRSGSLLILLAAGAYLVGRWQVAPAGASRDTAVAARKVLYYHCPMHPQYRSDRPGDAPCCGMRLEPVHAPGARPEQAAALPAGVFHVSPEKQQLVGVAFEPAGITNAPHVIRAAGKVAYDQRETVVIADVYEYESTLIRLGQKAWVRRPYPPRHAFWATVDYLYPRLDPNSRTLKIRLQAGDLGVKFIPDTFLEVEFRIPGGPALTVPSEAVMNSGLQQIVFIDRGEGLIEPRAVETGRRLAGGIEILKGLKRGERVAVSGVFLLDSESRMKMPPTTRARAGSAVDPVCGMQVVASRARNRTSRGADTYYFCSAECKRKFDANPELYRSPPNRQSGPAPLLAKGASAGVDQPSGTPFRDESGVVTESNPLQTRETTQKDPVCGMFVDTLTAGLRHSEYQGRTYHFCSTDCKRKFDSDPAAFVASAPAAGHTSKPATSVPGPPLPAGEQIWASAAPEKAGAASPHLDPVCGKPVDEKSAWVSVGLGRRLVREYEGRLFYFCSIECKREFDMNPAYYGEKALADHPAPGSPASVPPKNPHD